MRSCVVLMFCLMIVGRLFSQTIVSGNVLDRTSGQPVEFASITLIHLPDTVTVQSTATDKKGRFVLSGIQPGNYFLLCTFIGFDNVQTSSFTIHATTAKHTIAPIELTGNNSTLADVTVTGKRTSLNTSIDRKVYNVELDIMSRSGSASDILKNIPAVEVDLEGNVALRGSGDVMILINGKPSPLMGRTRAEVLQNLPANSIERIEVITNPSARYRPDGTSGIINIVLKKNVRNGFNGSASANMGNRQRYNGNLSLNYHPKKLNLFASYSFRQDTRNRFNNIDRIYFDSLTHQVESIFGQISNSKARPSTQILTGGLDFYFNEHNSIGISGTYFNRKQTRRDISNTLRYNELHNLISDAERLRYDPEFEKQKNATVYFQHQFPKEDHELRIEFNSSNEDEVEDNHYTNIYYFPSRDSELENTRIRQGTRENQLTADYSNPLTEDSKLEAGYDGLYNKIDLDFYGENFDPGQQKFVKDLIRSNQFLYDENMHALYLTYQRSYEHFGYSAGLRGEGVLTKSKLVNKDSTIRNNYFKIYPTLHLSYKLKVNKEVQLNYSKRVNRPEADELNPFPEYQDSLNLRAGNPRLLPEIIHSVELGYKWQNNNFTFVPSIYFRYKKNGFTNVILPLNDSVLLSTINNLSNDRSAGLELIFSAKAGKWFTSSLSSNLFYNTIDASNLGYISNRSIVSMSSNLTSSFTITKTTMLQLSANYRSARLTPQGKSYPGFMMNTGVRQDLLKSKLSVVFTASDLLNTLRQRNEYEIPMLRQTSRNRRDGRIIYLGISYRFGVIKKVKEEKLQFDEGL